MKTRLAGSDNEMSGSLMRTLLSDVQPPKLAVVRHLSSGLLNTRREWAKRLTHGLRVATYRIAMPDLTIFDKRNYRLIDNSRW
jgi:hypothetical protein